MNLQNYKTFKAKQMNVHPLEFLLPMTLSVSLAFMLPVATPTNALIFASGHIRIIDMVYNHDKLEIYFYNNYKNIYLRYRREL
jgi:hypothetical protein